jgi:hypothetical protein
MTPETALSPQQAVDHILDSVDGLVVRATEEEVADMLLGVSAALACNVLVRLPPEYVEFKLARLVITVQQHLARVADLKRTNGHAPPSTPSNPYPGLN